MESEKKQFDDIKPQKPVTKEELWKRLMEMESERDMLLSILEETTGLLFFKLHNKARY